MKKIIFLLILFSSFIWSADIYLKNLNFEYKCTSGDIKKANIVKEYQDAKKAVDKKQQELFQKAKAGENLQPITETQELKKFVELSCKLGCAIREVKLKKIDTSIKKGSLPLEDVEVHGKIYRLAEYFSDNDPKKAEEFKTAILDKRHPYLKKYLTNFKDAFGLEFGYKKDSGDFFIGVFSFDSNGKPKYTQYLANRDYFKSGKKIPLSKISFSPSLYLTIKQKIALKYIIETEFLGVKYNSSIKDFLENNKLKIKIHSDFDTDDLKIFYNQKEISYSELKNNGFYLDSGEYIFDIDNSGWFGTDYCFKPNKKFPYTCNVVFNKNDCERVAFEFPKIKKIEIDSCENIGEKLRAELQKLVNKNTDKIYQLASKIATIKDETKKDEFKTELTRIKKMPTHYYSPDEVAIALNNLEQDILAQQQKETKKAKPHRQTHKVPIGSNGTKATQITPEASSIDLEWKLECENCQSNDVICQKYNGPLFTHSDCKNYQKAALEIYKCKCIYINN